MGYGLELFVLGKYFRGLVVFGAIVCSRLCRPLGTLSLDVLAYLSHGAIIIDC